MTCWFSHFESRRPGNDKKVAADNARSRADTAPDTGLPLTTGPDTGPDTGLLREAAAELYAGDPAGFIQRRGDLAAQARASGDGAAAKAITGLRKPTRSAWAVNRLVRSDPDVPSRLTALGDDLRDAGRSLDGQRLRELSQARRDLIAALTRQALAGAGPARRARRAAGGSGRHPQRRGGRSGGRGGTGGGLPWSARSSGPASASVPAEDAGQDAGQDGDAPRYVAGRRGSGPDRRAAGDQPGQTARPRTGRTGQAERERAEREAERARAEREQAERERREAITAAEQAVQQAVQAADAAQSAERARAEAVGDARAAAGRRPGPAGRCEAQIPGGRRRAPGRSPRPRPAPQEQARLVSAARRKRAPVSR